MADKETEEELARKKKAEAEIFGKTLGFTHTPSPEELERTVILNPITPPAEEPVAQDFESTVRFSNFDALVDSNSESASPPQSPASQPSTPQAPASQPPAPPSPAAKPAPTSKPAAPVAPQEAKPQTPQAKAATPAAKSTAAPKPAAPVAPQAATPQAPQAKAATPASPTPPAAKPTPPPAVIPPAAELDLSDHDFGPGDLELNMDVGSPESEPIINEPPAVEPPSVNTEAKADTLADIPDAAPAEVAPAGDFDSGAALDELDELLKMDIPEIEESPASEEKESAETDTPANTANKTETTPEWDMSFLEEDEKDDVLDMTVGSMPTVQLGAADMTMGDDLLSPIDEEDDELAKASIYDEASDAETNDTADSESDDLIDLSGLESSLETDEDQKAETGAAETSKDEASMQEQDSHKAEQQTFDEFEEEMPAVSDLGEPEDAVEDDSVEDNSAEAETDVDIAAREEQPSESESVQEDSAPIAAIAAPDEAAMQEAVIPPAEQKRGGSGFAIFLSLLALAGAGASYWFSQGPAGEGAQLEVELAQTADRVSLLEANNRELATQINALTQKNETLEQQLGDLTRVVANRSTAAQKKSVNRKRPVIKPSTPVKPAVKAKTEATAKIPTTPVAKPKGWVINLTSVSSAESAQQEVARLQLLGVKAQSIRTEARGKIWYRIRVAGFATREEAEAQAELLGESLNIPDIWVGRP